MNTRLEIDRCRRLLVGLSGKLAEFLDRPGDVPHRAFADMVTEWRLLPQAQVNVIPDNFEGNDLQRLQYLTTVIDEVSRRLAAMVRDHAGDIPAKAVAEFKAELDRVSL